MLLPKEVQKSHSRAPWDKCDWVRRGGAPYRTDIMITSTAPAPRSSVARSRLLAIPTDRDCATEADFLLEREIKHLLAERTPDIPFVGEEYGGQQTAGSYWFLEPSTAPSTTHAASHYTASHSPSSPTACRISVKSPCPASTSGTRREQAARHSTNNPSQ